MINVNLEYYLFHQYITQIILPMNQKETSSAIILSKIVDKFFNSAIIFIKILFDVDSKYPESMHDWKLEIHMKQLTKITKYLFYV